MFDDLIENCINLLDKSGKSGFFLSLSSADPNDFSKAIKYHSIFSTALILSCLNKVPETPKIKKIKKRAAMFLLTQKSPYWSFNYWERGSQESKNKPYPDDLDDTFVGLSALFEYDPKLLDGKALASIVQLLTGCELQVGGPYKTWLVDDKAFKDWKDVDLAVNANIAYFLSLQEIRLPKLNKFIQSKIDNFDFYSPYYPSPFPVIYFLSRFFKGNGIEKMIKVIQKPSNPLEAALSVSAQLNFGVSPIKIKPLTYLIGNPPWKAFGFCIDPARDKKTFFAGSPSLTAAFCLEALAKYLTYFKSSPDLSINLGLEKEKLKLHEEIVKNVKLKFSQINKQISQQAEVILELVLKGDKSKQITLLPYYFNLNLGKKTHKISKEFLVKLGVANFFGWIAYTIYDNFLDDEGDPKTLSLANIALRELTTIFDNILPEKKGFGKFFHQVLDQIDAANTWEVTHCRFNTNENIDLKKVKIPNWRNYQKIAQKSLGHGLGPLAILFALGFKASSSQVQNLTKFFIHFLIAKQLNDDAHDWEKDLAKGHLNPVVSKLLIKFRIKKGKQSKLQELFWYEVIASVCNDILTQISLARKYLIRIKEKENKASLLLGNKASLLLGNNDILEKLLSPIEQATLKALNEQSDMVKFLKTY